MHQSCLILLRLALIYDEKVSAYPLNIVTPSHCPQAGQALTFSCRSRMGQKVSRIGGPKSQRKINAHANTHTRHHFSPALLWGRYST